ncbi:MAG: spherulation-specific family 4 protein [Chloroflexi bacterium]|nr:spherulation-specific family 4 protein [Chloroflexota bacterium]
MIPENPIFADATITPTLRMLIPLYSYPNWYDPPNYLWDDVAAANSLIPITTIINPNNGPDGCPPNDDYQHGLSDLRNAGVTILGYVYTSYGTRDLNSVKAEVDLYDQCFNIDGIFFDEAAGTVDKLPYYAELCNYVKLRPNLDKVFLNPGTSIDERYLSQTVCDTFVIFEGVSYDWPPYQPPPFIHNYLAERFVALIYDVPDICTVQSYLDLAVARNIGYVYITDDILTNPWDSLPIFWQTEVNSIASLNAGVTSGRLCLYLPLILKTP